MLQDWQAPTAVAAYRTAALDEGDRAVCFVALRAGADAHGLPTGASNAQRHRDPRSRMRSTQGHPALGSLTARRAALTGR
ncbi:MAG TPA: transcriptional regulator [Candidatus Tectomicrobia bacterium]